MQKRVDANRRLTPGFADPSPLDVERGHKGMRSPDRRELCRELRRRNTPAEEFFWELVRDRRFDGLKFRRQHPIGEFVADFYCSERRLVVELDGAVHDNTGDRDQARDEAIERTRIQVIRVTNQEVLDDPEDVLNRLRRITNERR
jgi:very-short-patch-repair endonuclease